MKLVKQRCHSVDQVRALNLHLPVLLRALDQLINISIVVEMADLEVDHEVQDEGEEIDVVTRDVDLFHGVGMADEVLYLGEGDEHVAELGKGEWNGKGEGLRLLLVRVGV